jgi:hypothetical protein
MQSGSINPSPKAHKRRFTTTNMASANLILSQCEQRFLFLRYSAMCLRVIWYISTKLYGVIAEKHNHHGRKIYSIFLISNFRHVLNVIFFLLGNSPASEFYMPTFRNFVSPIFVVGVRLHHLRKWNLRSVSKCRRIKFRRKGITQKNEYIIICCLSFRVYMTFGTVGTEN